VIPKLFTLSYIIYRALPPRLNM